MSQKPRGSFPFKSFPTHEEFCAHCGHDLDRATTSGGLRPTPGSFSVCIACAHVAIFDDQLRRRETTAAEAKQLLANTELQQMLQLVREMIRARSH